MTLPDNDSTNDNGARVPTWDPVRRAFVWRPFEPWPNRPRAEALERWRTCARKFWHERDNAQTGAPRSPLIDEQARARGKRRAEQLPRMRQRRALAFARRDAQALAVRTLEEQASKLAVARFVASEASARLERIPRYGDARQQAIAEALRAKLRQALATIADLERIPE